MGLGGPVRDYLRRAAECGDEYRRKTIDHQADQFCNGYRTEDPEEGALFGPVIFFRTQILADKGSEGQGKAGDRQEPEAFYLRIRAAAGYRHFSELIDVRLHHHVSQRDNGILQSCGKTVGNDLPQDQNIDPDPGKVYPVFLRAFHQLPQTEKSADKLGDNSSQGSGAYAEVEDSYKQKIQDNIYNGRDHQIDQRVTAVSHRLKDPHHEIIHNKGQRTGEIDPEVCNGIGKYLRRRPHQHQDLRSGQNPHYSQQDPGDKAESHDGMNGPLNDMELSGAVILCHYNACAYSQAVKKSHHEENQVSRGTYRRQSGTAQKSSYDKRVCSVIKLLKKITEEKRYGKKNDPFPNRTRCHRNC